MCSVLQSLVPLADGEDYVGDKIKATEVVRYVTEEHKEISEVRPTWGKLEILIFVTFSAIFLEELLSINGLRKQKESSDLTLFWFKKSGIWIK